MMVLANPGRSGVPITPTIPRSVFCIMPPILMLFRLSTAILRRSGLNSRPADFGQAYEYGMQPIIHAGEPERKQQSNGPCPRVQAVLQSDTQLHASC